MILLKEHPEEIPGRALHFFLMLLGNPLCRGLLVRSQDFAPVLGVLLLGALAVVVAVVIFRRSEGQTLAGEFIRFAPWLTLTSFGLISAAFITTGRIGMYGATGALFGRYVTFPALAWVGLIGLTFAVLNARFPRIFDKPRANLVLGFITGAFLLLMCCNWIYGSRQMAYWCWGRNYGQAALRFVNLVPSVDLTLIEGDPAYLKELANRMDAAGFLQRPLLTDGRLSNFKISNKIIKERRGAFMETPGSNGSHVEGVALMEGTERPADTILFVTILNGERTVFDVSRASALNPHIRSVAGRDSEHMLIRRIASEEFGAFESDLDTTQLPPGEHEVEAWIYRVDKNTVQRIPGSVRVVRP
jgi:hypothetical protein